MIPRYWIAIVAASLSTSMPALAKSNDIDIVAHASSSAVGMGQTIRLTATVRKSGKPIVGQELWAYLDGKRWGAAATTSERGDAEFLLALPNPGTAKIEVLPATRQTPVTASWIWSKSVQDQQTVYFAKSFNTPAAVRSASLYIACDDIFEAFLNGHKIASGANWMQAQHVHGLEKWLKPGVNQLTVRGFNGGGAAGLLALLKVTSPDSVQSIATGSDWQVFSDKPAGWPYPIDAAAGANAANEGALGCAPWGSALMGWPGSSYEDMYPIGTALPDGVHRSNPVLVRVLPRHITVARDPNHLVGMDWEGWFTNRGGAPWTTAEAIPVLGQYPSSNLNVMRQHILWMDAMGIDFLVSDWSNNLGGGIATWSQFPVAASGIVANTTALLDLLAQMRAEGVPVPQVTLLLGIGAPAAMNGQIKYVYDTYLANPRYKGLWVQLDGKPLIEILSVLDQRAIEKWPKIDPNGYFTIRWEWVDLARNPKNRTGWWSWMECVIDPDVAHHNGVPEAMTITPAFFGGDGWLGRDTVARNNGATYLHEFEDALKTEPQFVQINQWNEFLAAAKGAGGGPKHDMYVDVYNAPLSDDIEPTTPFALGYRGDRGWGFRYLNLTRAMIRLYRDQYPQSTVAVLASPEQDETIRGSTLHVHWCAAGKTVDSYTLLLDGKIVAGNVHGETFDVPLDHVLSGRHVVTVKANGATTRFAISDTDVDEDLSTPVPVVMSARFVKAQ